MLGSRRGRGKERTGRDMAKKTDFVAEAEDKVEAVEASTLGASLEKKITKLVTDYLGARNTEKTAGEMKKEAGEQIKEIVEAHGFTKLHCVGIGKVSYTQPSERITFGKDDLVRAMLNEGIDVSVINKVLNKAAKKSVTQAGIRVSAWAEKKDKD